MNDETLALLGKSLETAHRLEALLQQDSGEMEECTKGQVLTAYRDAMEQAISLLRKIGRQLQIFYDERKLIM